MRVYSIHTLKPINSDLILKQIRDVENIFTLEEHTIIGGLGSIISEIISESNLKINRFKRFGINDEFPYVVGDQKYLRKFHKLDSESISLRIENIIQKK